MMILDSGLLLGHPVVARFIDKFSLLGHTDHVFF